MPMWLCCRSLGKFSAPLGSVSPNPSSWTPRAAVISAELAASRENDRPFTGDARCSNAMSPVTNERPPTFEHLVKQPSGLHVGAPVGYTCAYAGYTTTSDTARESPPLRKTVMSPGLDAV